MNEAFRKHKKKYLLYALLKSAICGISAGLIAVGAVLLALKLSGILLHPAYYVLIAVGSAASAFGVALAVFYPTDKRLAKRLDNEFALEERVQTALEFNGEEGAMLEVQREDAHEKLSSLPKHKLRFARVWQFCLVAVLAVALSATAIFYPAHITEATDHNDDPYTPTSFEIEALKALIQNVTDSKLADTPKAGTLEELGDLLTVISEEEITIGEMQETVLGTIDAVDLVLAAPNTYEKISTAFTAAGLPYLAECVRLGATVYRDYPLNSFELTQAFYSGSYDIVLAKVETPLADFRATFSGSESELVAMIGQVTLNISGALLASGAAEDDGLRVAINRLVVQLGNLAADETKDRIQQQNDLDRLFSTTQNEVTDQLSLQAYNLAMNKFVGNSLRTIFGFPVESEDPDPGTTPSGPTEGEDDDPDRVHGGGYGSGDQKYGSADEIYDPATGKYVKYSELLGSYYSIVQEYLRNGKLTPEQEDIVESYFNMLFSGAKADEKSEE